MGINRDNYELFFIDYIDGNLSSDQIKEVEVFLLLNPDLNSEFENVGNHVLIPNIQTYKDKSLLKKSDYSSVGINNEFDYLCIASVENDINADEGSKLNRLILADKSMRTEYDRFHRAKLKPNSKIKFQHKAKLKRFTIFGLNRLQIVSFSSVTALVLLFFGLFKNFSDDLKTTNNSPVVQKIGTHPKNYFPELPYEVIPPKLDVNREQSDVPSVPIHESAKMKSDESRTKAVLIKEEVNRVSIAYLEPRELSSITVTPKGSEITLPPLYPEETAQNGEQIAHSSPSTNRAVGLYDLIQLGVNWIGKTSGTDLKLEGRRDEMGKLKRIQFESHLFALSVPINQKKQN